MTASRRSFLSGAAASALAWPFALHAQSGGSGPARLFQHGVASGDPLGDRVVLWTRVTPPATRSATGPIAVRWQIAEDESLSKVVGRGEAAAAPERDFTIKVDAAGLRPGRTYFYAFEAGGERSPIGRTKTLAGNGVQRLRLGVVSCSNYAGGYFNAYRALANRADLDAVIHLGDYIYEFADGVFGDTKSIGRAPLPLGEASTLSDYRLRYAIYRSDPDLQEAHRLHPFIVVWDDHEIADNAWSGGAANHGVAQGDWATRLAAAYRAYLEWLPVREMRGSGIRLYRNFPLGDLADLVMLDTRGLRDRLVTPSTVSELSSPRRSMLGAAQENWFFDRLRASTRERRPWRLVGQQVLFSPLVPAGPPLNPDTWDGYPAARARIIELLDKERIPDVAILTGDAHSSWAVDVESRPWPPAGSGSRPLGVEFVTPAISSGALFANETLRARVAPLRQSVPHIKYLDGDGNGYILLDVTRERLLAEWYFVPTVLKRTESESRAASFVCERGSARLSSA